MSGHSFDAGYWQEHYREHPAAHGHGPSASLVAEAEALPPGRALDAGCGHGADARWLAARGWKVTAVDVSAEALAQARQPGDGISWVCADLLTWEPDEGFDLVTSHYVHVPRPMQELVARLAGWVAPGGTLLVAGHGSDHSVAAAQLGLEQVTAALPAGWRVTVAELRGQAVVVSATRPA